MVVSGRKLGFLAVVGLSTVALFLASCGSPASNPGTTPTSNPPSVLTTGSSSTTSTTLASMPESVPADFSFVAAYGVMGRNIIDTSNGTFTKDLIDAGQVTTELRLTPDELATLYQDLVEMDILDYPSAFRPELGEQEFAWGEPHDYYRLSIHTSGIEKDVAWDAGYYGPEPRAVALRDWFTKLRGMIEAKPEYQAMPPAEGGYM